MLLRLLGQRDNYHSDGDKRTATVRGRGMRVMPAVKLSLWMLTAKHKLYQVRVTLSAQRSEGIYPGQEYINEEREGWYPLVVYPVVAYGPK